MKNKPPKEAIDYIRNYRKKKISLLDKRKILNELQEGKYSPRLIFEKYNAVNFYYFLIKGNKNIRSYNLQQNLLKVIRDEENDKIRHSQQITNYLLATGVLLTGTYYLIEILSEKNFFYFFLYSIIFSIIIFGLFKIIDKEYL